MLDSHRLLLLHSQVLENDMLLQETIYCLKFKGEGIPPNETLGSVLCSPLTGSRTIMKFSHVRSLYEI